MKNLEEHNSNIEKGRNHSFLDGEAKCKCLSKFRRSLLLFIMLLTLFFVMPVLILGEAVMLNAEPTDETNFTQTESELNDGARMLRQISF